MAKRRASGRSARGYHERRLNLQEPRQRFLKELNRFAV